jgi:negative regulator of flagellin synthesis FlgM
MAVNRNHGHVPAVVGVMMIEEDGMIDGIGRAGAPRPVAAAAEAILRGAGRAGEALPAAASGAAQAPATSNLARIAKDLAASPPVDTAKVETLRNAIASGAYRPDPAKIAERMMALEAPAPKAG